MGGGGFRFEKNARIKIDGVQLRMLKKQPNGPWQLEQTNTGTIVEYDDLELFELHYKGSLQFVGETSRVHSRPVHRELSEAEKAEVHWRMHFVAAVKGIVVTRHGYESAIKDAWESYKADPQRETTTSTSRRPRRGHTRPPGWITVYRWRIRYEQSGDNEYSLLNRGINKAASLNPDVADLIDEALNEVYLVRERSPLQEAVNTAISKCTDENERRGRLGLDPLKLPTRREVQMRLSLIPAFDVYAARFGRQAALTKFRFVRGHRITSHAFERSEIDHTPLDLFVVDDQKGLPLGRPYVTMCVDDYTRCILGLYVGFIPPSYQSVANCLKHAFLPKLSQGTEYPAVVHPWVPFGLTRTVVVDQAVEMHSEGLENACAQLGTTIEYAPRKTGWYKAKIERLLGRMNREVAHGQRGTTFSNIFQKGDYNPEGFAVIRLSTLQLGLRMWVCDIYHQKKHHALNMPPETMWKLNVRTEDIRFPADREFLDIIMGRPYPRVLSHKGVEFKGLYYGSDGLSDLRNQYGPKLDVQIRVDESDIGQIHVLYGDHVVPAKALRYDYASGLSLWLHQQIQKHSPTYDPDTWLAGKERLRRLFLGDGAATKNSPRRGKGRIIEQQPELALPEPTQRRQLPPPPAAPLSSTSLEFELSDLPAYKAIVN